MFKATDTTAQDAVQRAILLEHESTALNDLKKRLGFRSCTDNNASGSGEYGSNSKSKNSATLPTAAAGESAAMMMINGGYADSTLDAYMMRFLRSKNMSFTEALAKLKRRRAFESTLPGIGVTPAVISILRSGAFSLLGRDLKGRPILFLNLRDFTLPPIDVDEAQRLLVLLLEFMQSKCMSVGALASNTANNSNTTPGSPVQRKKANNCSNGGGAADGGLRLEQQSFVLLIDEEDAPWSVHLPLLRKSAVLYTLLAKYYPSLMELVLVAEAAFEVRQGIQAALAGSSADMGRQILMVQKTDIARYMSPDVTPACLGGRLETNGSGSIFADAVLRHWYTVTAYIQLENTATTTATSNTVKNAIVSISTSSSSGGGGGGGLLSQRPLYQPAPLISTAAQFMSLHRAAATAAENASNAAAAAGGDGGGGGSNNPSGGGAGALGSRGDAARLATKRGSAALFSMNTAASSGGGGVAGADDLASYISNTRLRATGSGGGGYGYGGGGGDDDGVCSELSLDDITMDPTGGGGDCDYDDDDDKLNHSSSRRGGRTRRSSHPNRGGASAAPARPLEKAELAKVRGDPAYAVAALEAERALRIQAEQRLKIAQLGGVALDPRNASAIEKQIASIHSGLNVLVADVVVKATTAATEQNVNNGGGPTVLQLLELTLTALEGAAAVPEDIPAMSLAVPQQREPKSSTCCSVM